MRRSARVSAAALAGGYAADLAFGDPRRRHPVAGFGRIALALERRTYAPTRARGALYAAALVGGAALAGELLARVAGRRTALALTTWAALGGRSLAREARGLAAHVAARRPAGGARRAALALRPRTRRPRRTAALPRGRRVGRREHRRRGRRDARLGRPARAGRRRRLPRREHARRDGRPSQRALRGLRLGGGAPRRRAELARARAAPPCWRRSARRSSAAGPAPPGGRCAATAPSTRARTPAAPRRRSPARSGCASAARSSTAGTPSCARCSATGVRPARSDVERAVRLSLAVGAAAAVACAALRRGVCRISTTWWTFSGNPPGWTAPKTSHTPRRCRKRTYPGAGARATAGP